jgi:hypothetical protein
MRPRVNVRGVWQRALRQSAAGAAEEEKQSITVTSGYSHLNKFQLSGASRATGKNSFLRTTNFIRHTVSEKLIGYT